MKRSDISDELAIELATEWRISNVGVVQALVDLGFPEKVALRKVEHLINRGLMDCGVSPYYAWPVRRPEPDLHPVRTSEYMIVDLSDEGTVRITELEPVLFEPIGEGKHLWRAVMANEVTHQIRDQGKRPDRAENRP